MKGRLKQAIFMCLMVIVLIGTAQMAYAATKRSGDWEYETYKEYGNSGTTTVASLTRYYGSATSVTVPSTIDGYKVKKMETTFNGNEIITSVTIPNGITDLDHTFIYCTRLKKVNLPSSITNYSGAFGDSGIEEITLPKGKYSMFATFVGCVSLRKVTILGSVSSLTNAFYGCSNLTSVSIASAEKDTHAAQTFLECENLQSVALPEGITQLESTFDKCTNLKTVYLPESAYFYGWGSFSYCYKLKDIYFAGSKCQWTGLIKSYNKEEGDKLSQATIHYAKADKHKYYSWYVVKSATCTANGKEERECSICGKTETRSIPKLGHEFSAWKITKEAAIGKPGTKERTCSRCGKKEKVSISTGLVKDNGKWVYMENGKLSKKTGITKRADGKGGWYYVEKGVLCSNKAGITKRIDGKGGWYYVEKGSFRNNKIGLTKRVDGKGGWFYVENGVWQTRKAGLTKRVDGKGGWFYVENGVWQTRKAGLTKRVDGKGGWFYVRKGRLDATMTGVVKRIDGKGGLYYVRKGVFQSKYTGTFTDSRTGRTYNIVRGVVK